MVELKVLEHISRQLSDYKSMKPYIDITESAQRDAISLMEKAIDAK